MYTVFVSIIFLVVDHIPELLSISIQIKVEAVA